MMSSHLRTSAMPSARPTRSSNEPGHSQAQSGLALEPQAHAEGEDKGSGRCVHVLNMRKPAHAGAVS